MNVRNRWVTMVALLTATAASGLFKYARTDLGLETISQEPRDVSRTLASDLPTNSFLVECISILMNREFSETAMHASDTCTTNALAGEEWKVVSNDLLPLTLAKELSQVPSVESSYVDRRDGVGIYVLLDSNESDFEVMSQLADIELRISSMLKPIPVTFTYIPSKYTDPNAIIPHSAVKYYRRE